VRRPRKIKTAHQGMATHCLRTMDVQRNTTTQTVLETWDLYDSYCQNTEDVPDAPKYLER